MKTYDDAVAVELTSTLQTEINTWVQENFGPIDSLTQITNVLEELGELSRALLKRRQGIRGTYAEWTAEVHKELADVFISLLALAEQERVSILELTLERWEKVRERDWKRDTLGHGMPDA